MNHDLVPAAPPPSPALLARADALVADLHSAVLSGRSANTLRAYRGDYEDFARFAGAPSASVALDQLVALLPGQANAVALAYRADLVERKLAPSTVARRLVALKSACKVARVLGRIAWTLDVEPPKAEAYRDTTGPGRDGWLKMLAIAKSRAGDPIGRRDLAVLRLLHDLALRRFEVCGLSIDHVDLVTGEVAVLGKGRTQRKGMTLPAPTRAALADWCAVRGDEPGPLVYRLDRASDAYDRTALSGESIRRMVARVGRAAGLSRVPRPHGLRHQGITHALDVTSGNVRAVAQFSRHRSLETLQRYDDNRTDLGGDVARLVAQD